MNEAALVSFRQSTC